MTTSILLHSPRSPSPSPASISLPALQPDLSSSTSTSDSGLDLLHSSAPSTRRIRFAPLPDLHRDMFDPDGPSYEPPQLEDKPATESPPRPGDLDDALLALSPSVSPDSTLSSARSTPTIRISPNAPSSIPSNAPSEDASKSNSKLFRSFPFFRRAQSSPTTRSPLFHSTSLPGSHNPSLSSLHPSSSSLPSSPSFSSGKPSRFSTEDILAFRPKSLFRARSGPATSSRLTRPSSPAPSSSVPSRPLLRSASASSGSTMKLGNGKHEGSGRSHDSASIAGSGTKKRRASSSALTPGAGGGRHTSSVKMASSDSPARPSTAPNPSSIRPKKYVKMLNGRIYGGRRYATQTLANPFANVRDDPEFVEWGYGGMGSVDASAGIGSDVWKGLQRRERGGALLAGSSFGSHPTSNVTAGGGRGSGASATSSLVRRKMSDNVPECGMGNVGAGGGNDEDDGSGMSWVKKRRAEREAKAHLEQEARELERKSQERRKSGDSIDASMYASTASTSTSLTACTSAASTDLTTPLTSRSPSVMDLPLSSPPSPEPHGSPIEVPCSEPSVLSSTDPSPAPTSKEEHQHHVLTAVRLSPNIRSPSNKHGHSLPHGRIPPLVYTRAQFSKGTHESTEQDIPLSPVDTETTASTNSTGEDEEEPSRVSDEEVEQDDDDDDDDDVQDMRRKTALGAGVEKISRHVDVEVR